MFVELALGGLHLSQWGAWGLPPWLAGCLCEGIEHVLVGDECVLGASRRPQRGRRLGAGLPACLSRGGAAAASQRARSRAEARRGEASPGGGCDDATECSRENSQLAPLYTSKLQKCRDESSSTTRRSGRGSFELAGFTSATIFKGCYCGFAITAV